MFSRAAPQGVSPLELWNRYSALEEEEGEDESQVPLLGEMARIEMRRAPESDDGEEDLALLKTQLGRARARYEVAQEAFEADRKRAYKLRRPQNRVVGQEYVKAYEELDRLAAKVSWAQSSRMIGCSSSSSCSGDSGSNSLTKAVNRFNKGFRGHP